MKIARWVSLCLLVDGAAWAAAPDERSPGVSAKSEQEGVIDPAADVALKRMSEYLAGLKSFRVETTTVDERVTAEGQKVQDVKESQVVVRRPNGFWVDRVGPLGHVIFRYDGQQFSVFLVDRGQYAITKAPGDLDAAIDDARDRLGVDAPGGDLMVRAPYEALIDGVRVGRYVGLEPMDGGLAHHLAMTEKDVDWQIWIKDGPEAVPLRYVITSKDVPGHPQFTIDLRKWQPDAPLSKESFVFTPPAKANRVEMSELLATKR